MAWHMLYHQAVPEPSWNLLVSYSNMSLPRACFPLQVHLCIPFQMCPSTCCACTFGFMLCILGSLEACSSFSKPFSANCSSQDTAGVHWPACSFGTQFVKQMPWKSCCSSPCGELGWSGSILCCWAQGLPSCVVTETRPHDFIFYLKRKRKARNHPQ